MPLKIDWIGKPVSEGDGHWLLVGELRNGNRVEMRAVLPESGSVSYDRFTVECEMGERKGVGYNMADIYRGHTIILNVARNPLASPAVSGVAPEENQG